MLTRILILFFLFSGPVVANDLFDAGMKAANEKNYTQAIRHFEEVIITQPGNTGALFNLGNCYFAEKQYGKAILQYEKAFKLQPGDEEIRSALQNAHAALGRSESWEPPYSFTQITFYRIGAFVWTALSVLFSLFASVLLYMIISGSRTLFIPLKIPLFIVSVLLIGFFLFAADQAENYQNDTRFAIVTNKEVPVLKNEFGAMSDRNLPEGERVEILEEMESQVLVQTGSGEKLLILSTDVERIQVY